MQGTKVQKRDRGITLIALVVTIIVLLILAGVSIQMLTGQSGILNQARQAKEETEKGQLKESVQREILEGMMKKQGEDLTADEMYKILDKYFNDVPSPEEEEWKAEDFPNNFPPLQSKEGGYLFQLGDIYSGTLSGTQTGETTPKAGNIVAIPEDKKEKWKADKVNPTLDEKLNVIPVPKDFHYVEGAENGTDEEKDNIGVVIADDEGNEFVWVPVPNAIADAETSEKIKASAQVNLGGFDSTTTPIAEFVDGNYRGVLYRNWNTSGSSKTVKYIQYNATGSREPDIVKGTGEEYDKVDANLAKIRNILKDQIDKYKDGDTFKLTMQEDYKGMVESVRDYGGFYVARYEMSLTDWTEQAGKNKAQFIKGATSASAGSSSANTWYGLYAYNKQFAAANGYSSVKSSMIWGSQYDAMMNWMARSGIDVASSSIEGKSKNTTNKNGLGNTGADDSTDVLNNVYDLLGNRLEWTLEAGNIGYRYSRGCEVYWDLSPSTRWSAYPGRTVPKVLAPHFI